MALLLHRHQPDSVEWRELYKTAFRYHTIADALSAVTISEEKLVMPLLRAQLQKMEFTHAGRDLNHPSAFDTLLCVKPEDLMSAVAEQDGQCFASYFIESLKGISMAV
ncbi:hypothetical protein BBP40_006710 [Aspergillus hancockii]|nr:hypothetical protein BBP40_006710 [Aspergillus hancockii]